MKKILRKDLNDEKSIFIIGSPDIDIMRSDKLPNFEKAQEVNTSSEFISESVNIKNLDYFYTNSISRASKTMSECRQIKQKLRKTGT